MRRIPTCPIPTHERPRPGCCAGAARARPGGGVGWHHFVMEPAVPARPRRRGTQGRGTAPCLAGPRDGPERRLGPPPRRRRGLPSQAALGELVVCGRDAGQRSGRRVLGALAHDRAGARAGPGPRPRRGARRRPRGRIPRRRLRAHQHRVAGKRTPRRDRGCLRRPHRNCVRRVVRLGGRRARRTAAAVAGVGGQRVVAGTCFPRQGPAASGHVLCGRGGRAGARAPLARFVASGPFPRPGSRRGRGPALVPRQCRSATGRRGRGGGHGTRRGLVGPDPHPA